MEFKHYIKSVWPPLLRGEDFVSSMKEKNYKIRGVLHFAILLLFSISFSQTSFAQDEATRKEHYNVENNVALSGYDPITYFANKPVHGKEAISYTYKGITYRFINDKSLSVFKANPDKYEPAYGGWCAYALAKEKPVLMEADPETFKIVDGKLYVFYNSFGINTVKKWNKDEPKSKKSADKNWNNIIKK